ncbi:DNA polymerase III subunit delta [Lutimonas zeaxanthinifaciens]|uniref:DNA polymerase III subunit delta n=1 Tax=Lutimonas zeaxanthinifaciens TaxID=3060215 RepID=UPI00265CBB73|nr:DNA polymerase III subunit delta [Lutimonas sp. YSD2104]WKK64674.1 DNA polymerase III subunit delta [Lutimonas sp. YSD2104]
MNRLKQIAEEIRSKNTKPIYFLMGEEAYYIDKISDFIENNVLTEEEKGFNQMVLYGRDVTIEDIIANAKRFPMMSEKQVVIVKEAQDLSRTIEKLADYAENPQPSTVLVICYKYKTIDKRKRLGKIVAQKGCLFESKKLYENQVSDWIASILKQKGHRIEPKAAHMLVEFLGTDLSKIDNELEKLSLVIGEKTLITPLHIEQNIGISKDFNNFELRKAIGDKEIVKANQIVQYFSQNPKSNPLVMTISLLNSFFTQLLLYHGLKDKGKINVAKSLRINPFFVPEYQRAARNYPMRKVAQVIARLREADLKSKGVGAAALPPGDILKELLFKIMH